MEMRRRDTIPVPIVTLNQEGEKLRTILRQPTCRTSADGI
jgi:hypothetical protein